MDSESGPDGVAARPTLLQLFLVFAGIALSGFGGVLPFARRTLVERRQWMSAEEFNDAFALCQMLPGPNVTNMAVVFGARLHGIAGAALAFFGLLGPPVMIALALAALYARFGESEILGRAMRGISAAAVGLFAATVMKMAMPLVRQKVIWPWIVVAIVFVAVALMRVPMPLVLIVVIPLNLFIVWRARA